MKVFLICNKIRTPDGTILESVHRHDFKSHVDSISGETYFVDGGIDYQRISVNSEKYPAEDLSVYSDADFQTIRNNLKWGTYGKNGDEALHYLLLKDMTTDHIEAIIKMYPKHRYVPFFESEIQFRKNLIR